MSMFLDEDEIFELTLKTRRDAQSTVLSSLGIHFKTRPDGSIAILKSHVEQVFSGGVSARSKRTKPDLSVVR